MGCGGKCDSQGGDGEVASTPGSEQQTSEHECSTCLQQECSGSSSAATGVQGDATGDASVTAQASVFDFHAWLRSNGYSEEAAADFDGPLPESTRMALTGEVGEDTSLTYFGTEPPPGVPFETDHLGNKYWYDPESDILVRNGIQLYGTCTDLSMAGACTATPDDGGGSTEESDICWITISFAYTQKVKYIAYHSWVVIKRCGEDVPHRYEVMDKYIPDEGLKKHDGDAKNGQPSGKSKPAASRLGNNLYKDLFVPDYYPTGQNVVCTYREACPPKGESGGTGNRMSCCEILEKMIVNYKFKDGYRLVPGPNCNTFGQFALHVMRICAGEGLFKGAKRGSLSDGCELPLRCFGSGGPELGGGEDEYGTDEYYEEEWELYEQMLKIEGF